MTQRIRIAAAATAIGVAFFGVGAYSGYRYGRSHEPVAPAGPRSEQIASNDANNIWTVSTGSTHRATYDSVRAFSTVGGEVRHMLRALVGDNHYHYNAYVLPEMGGFFTLIVHHDSMVPGMTKEQMDELLRRVETRLGEETFGRQHATR